MSVLLRRVVRVSFISPLTLSPLPPSTPPTLSPTLQRHQVPHSTTTTISLSVTPSPPAHHTSTTTTTSGHTHAAAEEAAEEIVVPDPPTDCCMSGCANCVWITYAAELAAIYKDGGKAAENVMKAIDDPSLKIFLNLELKELLREKDAESSD